MGSGNRAYGTTFKIGSTIAGVKSISVNGISVSELDTSDLADAWSTYTGGDGDAGTIELGLNILHSQLASVTPTPGAAPTAMEIDYPGDLGKFTFSGFVSNFAIEAQRGQLVTGTATVRISGQLTYVPPD